jgi:hypothetical protein
VQTSGRKTRREETTWKAYTYGRVMVKLIWNVWDWSGWGLGSLPENYESGNDVCVTHKVVNVLTNWPARELLRVNLLIGGLDGYLFSSLSVVYGGILHWHLSLNRHWLHKRWKQNIKWL